MYAMNSMAEMREEIQSLVQDHGALVFGVASVEEADKRTPAEHRPGNFLQGAKSVIVFGFTLSTAGAIRAPEATTQSISAHHGMKHIFALNAVLSHTLEKKYGYFATGLPGLPTTGDFDPSISLKACAEAAGLGRRALSSLIINPRFGPRVFYSAIATTAALPPDEPLEKNPCPHPECLAQWKKEGTTPCLAACPAEAISGELRGRTIARAVYDQTRCQPYALISHIERFTKSLETVLDEKDAMKRKMILYGTEFQRCLYDLYWSGIEGRGTCWICMNVCPVGRENIELL
jgi:epoxyqueuosine reductase